MRLALGAILGGFESFVLAPLVEMQREQLNKRGNLWEKKKQVHHLLLFALQTKYTIKLLQIIWSRNHFATSARRKLRNEQGGSKQEEICPSEENSKLSFLGRPSERRDKMRRKVRLIWNALPAAKILISHISSDTPRVCFIRRRKNNRFLHASLPALIFSSNRERERGTKQLCDLHFCSSPLFQTAPNSWLRSAPHYFNFQTLATDTICARKWAAKYWR